MFICIPGSKVQGHDVSIGLNNRYVRGVSEACSFHTYLTVCGNKFVWSYKYVAAPTID
jgi:hypothetical protein